MRSKLGQFTRTPPNGLALFVGYYETNDGKQKLVNYGLEPYVPLQNALYHCGSGFKTELLRNQIAVSSNRYGFIVIDGNIASFHVLDGRSKSMIFKYDKVELPKKHGRGGQSKNRFARIREEKRDWYTTKIAEFAIVHFIDSKSCMPTVDGLILAGSADLKFDLGEKLDQRLKKIFITYIDVQYGGASGFNEAIEKSVDNISSSEFLKEKMIVARFFEMISKGTDLYIFGLKETMYALTSGVVESLIVWSELPDVRKELVNKSDREKVEAKFCKSGDDVEFDESEWEVKDEMPLLDWLLEHYKDFGSKIELVSDQSTEGNQFVAGFGGIGAILRYPIQMPDDYVVEEVNEDDEISYKW